MNVINSSLVITSILSLSIGACGAFVAARAIHQTAEFEGRCNALLEENCRLRSQLRQTGGLNITISAPAENRPMTLARANRNWLNVKALGNGEQWQGQIGVDKFGHAIFESPAWSIRAGAMVVLNYQKKHGLNTIRGLVSRYCEGNRENYIKHICKALDVKPDQQIVFADRLGEILRAMVRFESGEAIGDEHLALIALK